MGDVVRMDPNTIAVFFSMDAEPRWYVKLCNDAMLFDTVHAGMWMNEEPTEQSRTETDGVLEDLRETGNVDFEDGWIQMRVGMAAVVEWLTAKAKEATDEATYEDKRRFEEMKRREEAECRYELLRQALVDALGGHGPEIAAKAAA
jgi:hypothetical protein